MNPEQVTPLWPDRKPDFERLRRVLLRQELPDRVPFIELFADIEIIAAVLGEQPIYPRPDDRDAREAALRQRIRFCRKAGYDFVWAYPRVFSLTGIMPLLTTDTAELSRPQRAWVNESEGVIATMEGYDLEYVAQNLPEGMQIIGATSGVLEWVMWLMGFVPFALALHDQPELVEAMFQRIGDVFAAAYETMVDMDELGAVFLGDDMGFRTATFIRPEQMRQYLFPRQRRLVEIAHSRDLPFLLHACGNLELVMDDLIDDVGIDGKHSYEDTIMPVAEAKNLYGDRIAILGGIDMDFLTRSSEEEVRAYTRRVLEACMVGGGYALGTGNTAANYVPLRNYLAMLDEGAKVGVYR